jgi:transposase-like protein
MTHGAPDTLLEAVQYFADKDVALAFVANTRWPRGPECPHCHAPEPLFLQTRRIWKCRICKKQFSVKVGTIFEDSPLSLSKWLPAMWMLANCKNGISSYELSRAIGVTQKTAWFMLSRLRLALQSETGGKFGGKVEADETYIGGKARNMHYGKRKRVIRGRGPSKVAVLGLLQRHSKDGHSKVRVTTGHGVRRHKIHENVRQHVEAGASLYSDAFSSYQGLDADYMHKVIDHAERYVDGQVHTNGMENFWSLLKRGLNGTYVSVEPFHLFRYLDEQAFRFNLRGGDDAARFSAAISGIVGKRLTYNALRGKEGLESCPA